MTEDNTAFLRDNYSDLICIKNEHEQIDFKKFLSRFFNTEISLIDNSEIHEILKRRLEPKEYGDIKKGFFIKYGVEKHILISKLKFYQSHVGIAGSFYHKLNDPVFVVEYKNNYILWEGYHRVLFKIVDRELFINCYVMVL